MMDITSGVIRDQLAELYILKNISILDKKIFWASKNFLFNPYTK